MKGPRVIVVAKRSAYTRFVEGDGDPRARKLLKEGDRSVRKWLSAHNEHEKTLEKVEASLDRLGAQVLMLRGAHAAFDARSAALVVAVGGDGTLLAASHNVVSVPLLGINSAPRYSVGFFCAGQRKGLLRTLAGALDGSLGSVELSRMSVVQNGQVRARRVLNEALFSHSSPAATSTYILRVGRRIEEQRSSGFWIGPAAGSTAAQRSAGGRVLPLTSRKLQLVVREPYFAPGQRYHMLRVVVNEGQTIAAQSKMGDACMFLDGPYRRIAVRLGDHIRFERSDQPLTVLGLSTQRQRFSEP